MEVNVRSVYVMRRIGVGHNGLQKFCGTMNHVASSEGREYHTYCPETEDSWSQFQKDKVNGTNSYQHGKGFDPEGFEARIY